MRRSARLVRVGTGQAPAGDFGRQDYLLVLSGSLEEYRRERDPRPRRGGG